MSVYIRGMEMPTDAPVIIKICPDGSVSRVHEGVVATAIPVPDHGRLIDADALTEVIISQQDDDYNKTHQAGSWARAFVCMEEYINIAPTIIPASKEDGE